MKLTILDGSSCIGGNKIHIESDGVGLLLDFGLNYSKFGVYYEEFLKPRTTRGIYDFAALNLIPPVSNIYRSDIIPQGFTMPGDLKLPVDALFLSHAHMDHVGHVSLLNPDIPTYCSTMTAAIMKAMQDCTPTTLDCEFAYLATRDNSGDVIASNRKAPNILRKFNLTDADEACQVNEFLLTSFCSKNLEGEVLQPTSSKINGMEYRVYPVDHSIHGASAFSFNTDTGWVVYTGDLRMHGANSAFTREFIEQAKALKPKLLIVEGTNANEKTGHTEDDVRANCLAMLDEFKGKLIVADFGPRNIERLQTFRDIASTFGRRIVITAKDTFMLHAMHLADDSIPDALMDDSILVFDEKKGVMNQWESKFIREQYADKFIGAQDIRAAQGDFIVAFSFWDIKHLLDIMPDGGAYIYSSCEAFSEEMQIDVWRLGNWIKYFNLTPVGFCLSDAEARFSAPEFVPGYHASGHISGPELMQLIRDIGPETVIPIHTENHAQFEQKLGGDMDVVRLYDGQTLQF